MSDVDGGGGRKGGSLKAVSSNTPQEIFAILVAVVTVGVSVTGMIMTGFGRITIIAGIFSSLIAPYSYYQQTKLTDVKALKEAAESVTANVDRLASENVRLHEQVAGLSETMDGLEDVEGALDVITQTQGASIETFARQVKENREILETLKRQLRASVLQNLLQVVIASDSDKNMTIEEDEIDPLITRIQKINRVEIMEDKFKGMIISSGGSLESVMNIIKNMTEGAGNDGDGVFKLHV